MRIGAPGAEKPAARIDEETYVDVSDVVDDFDEAFFGGGGVDRIRPTVAERAAVGEVTPFAGARIGAPIARPHQILCIGLNYRDHAAETGQAVPTEPILFTKSPNTLVGPNDDVRIPRGGEKTDWEVELGVVVAGRASYLDSPEQARDHIAGYVLVNDVSERAWPCWRGSQPRNPSLRPASPGPRPTRSTSMTRSSTDCERTTQSSTPGWRRSAARVTSV